jgi:LmbE family N-acetylglucosaminyl deacetylase
MTTKIKLPGQLVTVVKRSRRLLSSPRFDRFYPIIAALLLFATSFSWAIQGARLNLGNADQLSSPYLFENSQTFHNALFPSQHTFLLKWPLFWVVKFFGFTSGSLNAATVFVALATVAALAYIIYRIDRRPLVFGTLWLGLASVLLLVPAQPYAGGLLPVNLAMLTTRNIEYILYILILALLARSYKLRSWYFWIATALLALLIMSDKLFMTLSLGGALLALIGYALAKGWKMVGFAVNWLAASVIATLAAAFGLGIIQSLKLTHIAGQSGTVGPYALINSLHDGALAFLYGALSLFTNLGANPAYDATVVRDIPHHFASGLFSAGGLGYLVNIVLCLAGLIAVVIVLRRGFIHNRLGEDRLDTSSRLAIALIWSLAAGVVAFIVTMHYYAVDARYLGLGLFTLFISTAVYARRHAVKQSLIAVAAVVLMVGILSGFTSAQHTYHKEQAALDSTNQRNSLIAQALGHHHTASLVGDYWRVLPIKQQLQKNHQSVMPLGGCSDFRSSLTSNAWKANLHQSFAYLLTFDVSLTDFPHCSLDDVVKAYGRPNSSALIAGTIKSPKELLLFYDQGEHVVKPFSAAAAQRPPASVVPVALDDLPSPKCSKPVTMTIVAHEDDDLLFTNPDLVHDVQAGRCVRTVYITAGDAGHDSFYWLGREQGSQAAYSTMFGEKDVWVQRIVELAPNKFIVVDSPLGNPRVTLVFMHLPDGNLHGDGFAAAGNQSLAKLDSGRISTISSVDKQSAYSSDELQSALSQLMDYFQPAEIHTQANYLGHQFQDHSDHLAAGRFVQRAYDQYEEQHFAHKAMVPIKFYLGYPGHELGGNVYGADLEAKKAAFLAYGGFDGGVCHSEFSCLNDPAYGAYLVRQHEAP